MDRVFAAAVNLRAADNVARVSIHRGHESMSG